MSESHLTSRAAVDPATGRVVAVTRIRRGEMVAAFGGQCVTRAEYMALDPERRRRSLQIDDDLYLAGSTEPEPADLIAHSCAPTCGISGSVTLVALRDLSPGEVISYDFAMSEGDDEEFDCTCGAPECRRHVTGHDWADPALQLRYRGLFSTYLARRISQLVHVGAERRAFAL